MAATAATAPATKRSDMATSLASVEKLKSGKVEKSVESASALWVGFQRTFPLLFFGCGKRHV
jgi:hypothetical protein